MTDPYRRDTMVRYRSYLPNNTSICQYHGYLIVFRREQHIKDQSHLSPVRAWIYVCMRRYIHTANSEPTVLGLGWIVNSAGANAVY